MQIAKLEDNFTFIFWFLRFEVPFGLWKVWPSSGLSVGSEKTSWITYGGPLNSQSKRFSWDHQEEYTWTERFCCQSDWSTCLRPVFGGTEAWLRTLPGSRWSIAPQTWRPARLGFWCMLPGHGHHSWYCPLPKACRGPDSLGTDYEQIAIPTSIMTVCWFRRDQQMMILRVCLLISIFGQNFFRTRRSNAV